jgi:hypothetical protein
MGILALSADERARDVRVSEDTLTVDLMDGRTISVPLVWYPRFWMGHRNSGRIGRCAPPVTASTGQIWTRISAQRVYCGVRRPRPLRHVA